MNASDLQRFAEDLRCHVGLRVEAFPDPDPEGLHVLRVNDVDFFFRADGSGYDGWGKALNRARSQEEQGAGNKMDGETMNEKQKSVRVVIYVSGGLVQDVLGESEGVEAMIVDYDNEKDVRPVCSKPLPICIGNGG